MIVSDWPKCMSLSVNKTTLCGGCIVSQLLDFAVTHATAPGGVFVRSFDVQVLKVLLLFQFV